MRRRLIALIAVSAMLSTVAACGDDSKKETSNAGDTISGVTITGDVGCAPKVDIKTPLKASKTVTQVVTEGDGDPVVDGQKALLHLYLANGTTGEKAGSTYDEGKPADVTVTTGQLPDPLVMALVGEPQGSRVAVASSVKDIYGASGGAQLGLKDTETIVFVIDVMADDANAPSGTEKELPSGLPTPVEEGGKITNLDFSKAAKTPSTTLQVIPMVEGDGPKVTDPSLITVNYLGQVYDGKAPFESSFTKEPATFDIGEGSTLIAAWNKALVGLPTGSRVMLVVPPGDGYGEAGNPQIKVGPKDTMVFIVDVLRVC